jgi:pimeloyl-ACP methyl ester carboxylesterase
MVAGLLGVLIALVAGLTLWDAIRDHGTSAKQLDAQRPRSGMLVNAGDSRIFVQRVGNVGAPAVVFVSGTGGWSGIWRSFMSRVAAQGYQAIALDVPPFGYSIAPVAGHYDKATQAQRILAALDSLGIKQATFVAHSIGSGPVMEAVLAHPERVTRLILIDPALGLDAPQSDGTSPPLQRLFRVQWFSEAMCASVATNRLFTTAMVRSFVTEKEKVTPEWVEQYRRPLALPGAYRNVALWVPELFAPRGRMRSDDPTAYANIRFPVVLIWGERDSITPLAQGRHLETLIPGSKLQLLPGGHVPMIEEPEKLAGLLEGALATR